jgi:hypothetical protein
MPARDARGAAERQTASLIRFRGVRFEANGWCGRWRRASSARYGSICRESSKISIYTLRLPEASARFINVEAVEFAIKCPVGQ